MTYVADLPDEGTVTEYCIILAHFFRAESRRGRHVWSLFSAGVAGERVPAIQHNWPVGSHLLLFSIRAQSRATVPLVPHTGMWHTRSCSTGGAGISNLENCLELRTACLSPGSGTGPNKFAEPFGCRVYYPRATIGRLQSSPVPGF